MPRLPTIRCGALAELAGQLRFAPASAARRLVERCEALVGKLEPGGAYPEDWVAFQITGFRPSGGGGSLLSGQEVLRDLGALVARLSVAARWVGQSAEVGGWIGCEELAARWGVSRRSLERWRELGLWSRRVVEPAGGAGGAAGGKGARVVSAYTPATVARFERLHAAELAGARQRPARVGRERAASIAGARRAGETANAAARRLLSEAAGTPSGDAALAGGLSRDGLRRLLLRAGAPGRGGGLDERGARLAARALERGVPSAEVARRLGASRSTVERAWARWRAQRAIGAALSAPRPPREAGERLSAAGEVERVLAEPASGMALGAAAPSNLAELVVEAQALGPPVASVELARARAWWALLERARAGAAGRGPGRGGGGADLATIDAVERDLLWAARLKAELVRSQVPLLLRTAELAAGVALDELPPGRAEAVLEGLLKAAVEAVEVFDPWAGGRLSGPAGLGMGRAGSRLLGTTGGAGRATGGEGRARAIVGPQRVAVWDWSRHGCSWQRWLEPPAWARAVAGEAQRVDDGAALWASRRAGWALHRLGRVVWGERPLSLAEAGAADGLRTLAAARRRERAVAAVLVAARGAGR